MISLALTAPASQCPTVQLDVGGDVSSPGLDVKPRHAASLPPPVLHLGLLVLADEDGLVVLDVLHHHPHLVERHLPS